MLPRKIHLVAEILVLLQGGLISCLRENDGVLIGLPFAKHRDLLPDRSCVPLHAALLLQCLIGGKLLPVIIPRGVLLREHLVQLFVRVGSCGYTGDKWVVIVVTVRAVKAGDSSEATDGVQLLPRVHTTLPGLMCRPGTYVIADLIVVCFQFRSRLFVELLLHLSKSRQGGSAHRHVNAVCPVFPVGNTSDAALFQFLHRTHKHTLIVERAGLNIQRGAVKRVPVVRQQRPCQDLAIRTNHGNGLASRDVCNFVLCLTLDCFHELLQLIVFTVRNLPHSIDLVRPGMLHVFLVYAVIEYKF